MDGNMSLSRQAQELFEINHCLLDAVGVGHFALDDVIRVADKFRFPTKLTGAGGGGCAVSLIPPGAGGSYYSWC